MIFRTRFAPSPTGPLHLGHAYSAILAHDMAKKAGGAFLVRIEDIDTSRARPEWEAKIFDDLNWLGLTWERPVLRQRDRLAVYEKALGTLWASGLLFQCTCKRRDILDAANAPHEAVRLGPDGAVYPGSCRLRYPRTGAIPKDVSLRLDMDAALQKVDKIKFQETGTSTTWHTFDDDLISTQVGDVVLARKDMGTSYHLSVVLDDAFQGITHVVRGDDLFEATQIHVVLQKLLGLPTPIFHHHTLITDDTGKRLAKRDDARAIGKYREDGATPEDIRQMVGL